MRRPENKIKEKLVLQFLICIVLTGIILVMDRADFDLTNKAISVFKKQIEKDYTVSEIADEAVTLGKAVIEKPAEVYGRLVERSGSDAFILPTDEITAAVFERNSSEENEGSQTENTIEFVSEEEIIVYAAKSGMVTEIVLDEETGTNTLILSHNNNITTKYIGCTHVYIKESQRVKKGDIIASVNNGKLNKLQFEIWEKDEKADPYAYINQK